MNLIVGALLYHCKDFISFWIFENIMNKIYMRDLFEDKMIGYSKHI